MLSISSLISGEGILPLQTAGLRGMGSEGRVGTIAVHLAQADGGLRRPRTLPRAPEPVRKFAAVLEQQAKQVA